MAMMSTGECQWVHCVSRVTDRPWTVGPLTVVTGSGMVLIWWYGRRPERAGGMRLGEGIVRVDQQWAILSWPCFFPSVTPRGCASYAVAVAAYMHTIAETVRHTSWPVALPSAQQLVGHSPGTATVGNLKKKEISPWAAQSPVFRSKPGFGDSLKTSPAPRNPHQSLRPTVAQLNNAFLTNFHSNSIEPT